MTTVTKTVKYDSNDYHFGSLPSLLCTMETADAPYLTLTQVTRYLCVHLVCIAYTLYISCLHIPTWNMSIEHCCCNKLNNITLQNLIHLRP